MTNQQHPITPPPELVEEWRSLPEYASQLHAMSMVTITTEKLQDIATQAARWGADQEMLACGNYLEKCDAWEPEDVTELYNYRRPRPTPPSLKEQALQALASADGADHPVVATVLTADQHALIRRALEQLE